MLSMKIVNDLNMSDTSFKMLINSFNFVEDNIVVVVGNKTTNLKEPVLVEIRRR